MIVFTCGGTGGHVYPAIALAQEIDQEFFFVGSKNRPDSQIIKNHGYPFFELPLPPNHVWSILKAFFIVFFQLKKAQVKLVVSTGGLLTMPVCLAAYMLKIPIFLLEQNSIPGRVNRILNYIATKNFISFKSSLKFFAAHKTACVGNPVRKYYLKDKIAEAYEQINWSQHPKILIFGGSQGSYAINDLVKDNYDQLTKLGFNIIHITGPKYFQEKITDHAGFKVIEKIKSNTKIFIASYYEQMDQLYKGAEMVVCRAGATSIAELLYFKRKGILIPYPYAKDNHQYFNAREIEARGQIILLEEKFLTMELLIKSLLSLRKSNNEFYLQSNNARECIANQITEIL